MITTHKIPHGKGELRIGWASWDDGSLTARSIKYAYPDSSGKISRGSPELPFDVLVAMVLLAAEKGELDKFMPGRAAAAKPRDVSGVSPRELVDEKDALTVALTRIQGLIIEVPWADWQPIYDEIGARLDAVKDEIAKRSVRR